MTQQTTNPTTDHRKDHPRLGDRDPVLVLAETPAVLARIVDEHTTERRSIRPAGSNPAGRKEASVGPEGRTDRSRNWRARAFDGKWTPNEILGHFGDAEWAFGWRTRQVLGDKEPILTGFDQDGWVAAQRLNDRDHRQLLEMFGQLRDWNLEVWSRLTPQDLARVGQSKRRGPVTLRRLLENFAEHDLHHIDHLTRYLQAIKASG